MFGCERRASTPEAGVRQITVFAAASTADVLRTIAAAHEKRTGVRVAFSFDASSTLAKQIKAGGPAEVFISADQKWMDDVESAGALDKGTRVDLLANRLVLIAPVDRAFEARIARDFDLAQSLPQIGRIAVGDPAHVPAGRYARQALEWLGWWTALEPRLMPATDVRAALLMDEPPSSLDRRLKGQILPYLRRVIEATGVPVMYVSHDLTEILRFTDELIVLDRGLVAAHGRFNEMHFEESAARRGNRYHCP